MSWAFFLFNIYGFLEKKLHNGGNVMNSESLSFITSNIYEDENESTNLRSFIHPLFLLSAFCLFQPSCIRS